MKIKNLLAVAALALFAGANAYAQDATQEPSFPKIYINPGHGSWTSNDRPMNTIKHGLNDAYNSPTNDTTNFFESNTNLRKAYALLDQLVEYGVPFDRTKNQENADPSRLGAALDLSQTNIVMSHVKAGAWPPYTDYANHTANPDNSKYNRSLSEIGAEAEAWGADMFISIHSNALTEAHTVNYLYFALDGYTAGSAKEKISYEMSAKGWDHRIRDRHSQWTNYDNPVSGGSVKIGGQNLGVLNHDVPGYLVEGYFHTYQPARHKWMNFGVCRLEGIDYARGVADYYGWPLESKGDVYGVVRDKNAKFTHEYYTPRAGTYDVYKPLNNVTVNLMQGETVVATTTTDDEWNGVFIFNDVEPGDYTLTFSAEGYKADSVWVTDKATEDVQKSIPVKVEAAKISYPTAFIQDKNFVNPTITFVNYPDSTAGKSEYVLKNKYKMYSDGEFNALQTALKDKKVRRTLVREDSLYVLAVDSLNAPLLLIADLKSNAILDTLSTAGCEGTHYVLSDIQLTADGYLIGCAKEWNQCAPDYVYQTGDANHQKYGYGDERGLCWVYKWAKNEKGAPTGDPIKWASTDYTGNWYRALVGETMAYTGTMEEGLIVLSAQTATGTAMRTEVICISGGQQASKNYHQPYFNGAAVDVKETSIGEEGYTFVTSPNDAEQYVVVSAGEVPNHVYKFTHTNKENELDKAAFAARGATFFKYAGKSLMVAPAFNEGKVTGIKMWDVTDSLKNATEVELVNATIEPVAAAYASAHGKLQLTLDEVTGNVAKAEIDMILVTDSVVTKFTATPPAAVNVTPGAGTANPFAYGLSGEVADATLKVNYSLNVAAQAVKVVVMNEEGEVVAEGEAAAEAGAHTAEISLANVATGNYNWGIEVTGDAKTTVSQFVSHSFYHPCGLDVDNSFESPSFGTLFVAEGYTAGKKTGYHSAQADGTDGGGLYIFDPAGNAITNPVTGGYRFYGEGLTHSYTYHTSTMGADFKNVAIADDGRIFVTRYNSSGDYILSAPSLDELVKAGKFTTSLVAGMTMTDAIYNDAEGNFIVGPMHSFDVKGAGEETKLLAMTRDVNNAVAGSANNRVIEYELGAATVISAGTPVAALDAQYTASYDKTTNVIYDNRGGIWFCQYRGTPDDTNPALIYVDADGNIQYFEGKGGSERRRGSISVSPDGTKLAAAGPSGYLCIFDVEYDEATGEVSLIETFHVKHNMGSNLYALAWDAAGNLYAGNASGEYMNGFSVPRGGAFITKAASKYAFEFENSAIESVESEEIDAPAEYYNLQGIKVANPANGIFIKKQGNKATKVVL